MFLLGSVTRGALLLGSNQIKQLRLPQPQEGYRGIRKLQISTDYRFLHVMLLALCLHSSIGEEEQVNVSYPTSTLHLSM